MAFQLTNVPCKNFLCNYVRSKKSFSQ
uniref:Uncharacterized protein n=1 Tax=Arundo donax TaxID=35708 RepID=A0A0A8Y4E6_ARUDO